MANPPEPGGASLPPPPTHPQKDSSRKTRALASARGPRNVPPTQEMDLVDELLARDGELVDGLVLAQLGLEALVDGGALLPADVDGLAPLGGVHLGPLGGAPGQAGPEPRVAVMGGVLPLEGLVAGDGELVVLVVPQDEAARRGLGAQVVVQGLALGRGDFCGGRKWRGGIGKGGEGGCSEGGKEGWGQGGLIPALPWIEPTRRE